MRYELDPLQQKAVHSESRNTLVVAAPGSGKTTVIINRIVYLIKEQKVPSDNIVVITFTRAAAENMRNRYLNISEGEDSPYFGTMHSLFYKMLRKYNYKINIVDEVEVYRIINKVLLTYLDEISEEKVKQAINNISLYKTSNKTLEEFQPSIDKKAFLDCLEEYEAYKRENSLMDFDDLQIECKKLLEEKPKVLDFFREKYKYILVDEFQDCDDMQIQILKLLNFNNSIFAVGDEDQSIYGFRGSKPKYMVDFKKIFLKSKVLFLNVNYRSPSNIVDISNKLIRNNLNRNPKEIKAYKNYSTSINIISCSDEGDEAERISKIILNLREKDKVDFEKNAIIYRTNRECSRLIDVFVRDGIPFNIFDREYNMYEHFICKDLIAYIKLSRDNTDKESFLRIVNRPFRYISKLNLERLKRINIKEDVFHTLCSLDNISISQIKEIKKLKKLVNSIKKYSIKDAVGYINKQLCYHRYVEEFCLKNKINITSLDSIIESFIASSNYFNSQQEFLLHIDKIKQELNNERKNKDGVILSTIHGVKGMEFKNLFIINCNCDNIPYSKDNYINIEEERRLFYVAITRTMENLWICYNSFYNGIKKDVSPFIKECELRIGTL